MNAVHPGVVCAIVLCLALGTFAVLSHLAVMFIDRYELRTMVGPRRNGRPPR